MTPPRSSTLVGRDAELEQLCLRLGIRASGDGSDRPARALLLAGDAGVGKTRLLTELRDSAQAGGWRVVAGHCLDFADSALPYLPFTEVLGRLVDELPETVAQTLERHPALARLQPGRRGLGGAEAGSEGTLEPRQLFEAFPALLEDVAADAPLLLVVEDIHWADRSTLDLLSLLFARPFSGRVELVASYRSDDLHRRHPLRRQVAEWSRLREVERLQLEPLPGDDVRRLVRLLEPDRPLSEAAMATIVARAEGNAFFVEELVGAGAAYESLPDDLAGLLLVRLDRLDPEAREVVQAAATAGRRVAHDLLAEATGLASGALDLALRGAVDGNVLVPVQGESYAFRHALLAEAVYDDLLPGERVRWHTAYARALASGRFTGAAAELARHARLAGDVTTAVRASIEAGDEAAAVGGPDEASQHYLQALTLVSQGVAVEDVPLADLVAKAADAVLTAGHTARAIRVVREHLDLLPPGAPPEQRARLLTTLAQALLVADGEDDPAQASGEAVALLEDGPPRQRAQALAVHARILAAYGLSEEARQAGLEALTIAEKQDMPRLATDVLISFAQLERGGTDAETRAALEDAVAKARAAGAHNAELRARYLLGRYHQDRAEFLPAAEAFAEAQRRGAELGLPWAPYVFDARFMRVAVLHAAGRWDEALGLADVAGESPPMVPEDMLNAQRALILAGRGDPGASRLAESTRGSWDYEGLAALNAWSTVLAVHEHHADAARAVAAYDLAVESLTRMWRPWFAARLRLAATTLGVLATAAVRLTAAERQALSADAQRLHADGSRVVSAHREAGVSYGPEGAAWVARLEAEWLRWRWAAQVDPPAHADLVSTWSDLEQVTEAYGHVSDLARVRVRLAAVLRAAGDAAAARAAADAARAVAHELRAQPLLDELVLLGSAPGRGGSTGAADGTLTPREREILALVAEGRTNGEIGRQLFISTKTVSVHVSNILGKLGASGRTEAAALARRRGLLD
ncbi:MAG: AAA family ATPase [Nocardioidaceae bacterium]